MEERLKCNQDIADQYHTRFENASKSVAKLKASLYEMFKRAGCSTPAVRELIGDSGITDQNILQHLSVIEQRVNEILRVYAGSLQRTGEDIEHLKVPFGQTAVQVDNTRVAIAPPSTMDDEYDDMDAAEGDTEAELRPLGQEQLASKVQSTLKKKAGTSIFRVSENAKRTKPSGVLRTPQGRN
jgi:coiled-coil domain-containing protein 63/114